MNIEYKITEYFENNNLFDDSSSEGLNITNEDNSLVIKGNSRDLVELADILVSIAKSKGREHIHLGDNTLLNKNSYFKELIIEKK